MIRCVDMTYTSGWIKFKDEYYLEIAEKVMKYVMPEHNVSMDKVELKLEFSGEEYGTLDYALLHMKGVVDGDIDSSGEDDDSEWFYLVKKGKWFTGGYKKVRGKAGSLKKDGMLDIPDKEKQAINDLFGSPLDRMS